MGFIILYDTLQDNKNKNLQNDFTLYTINDMKYA
jgi:hypothetical protein